MAMCVGCTVKLDQISLFPTSKGAVSFERPALFHNLNTVLSRKSRPMIASKVRKTRQQFWY